MNIQLSHYEDEIPIFHEKMELDVTGQHVAYGMVYFHRLSPYGHVFIGIISETEYSILFSLSEENQKWNVIQKDSKNKRLFYIPSKDSENGHKILVSANSYWFFKETIHLARKIRKGE